MPVLPAYPPSCFLYSAGPFFMILLPILFVYTPARLFVYLSLCCLCVPLFPLSHFRSLNYCLICLYPFAVFFVFT
jgi:hypothetical protein